MGKEDDLPINVKEFEKRWLFGFFKVQYLVEDRRPDLEEGEYHGKFKHHLWISFLWRQYAWLWRTDFFEDTMVECQPWTANRIRYWWDSYRAFHFTIFDVPNWSVHKYESFLKRRG